MRFEGNTPPKGTEGFLAPQTDRALRNAISQPAPSRLGLVVPRLREPAWFDETALADDGLRIEVWYADHGYFDARLTSWEVMRPHLAVDRDGVPRRSVRPVVLVGQVQQGTPSRVRTVDITGIEALLPPLRRKVMSRVALAEGDIFSRAAWQQTVDDIETALHDQSFAYARVTPHAVVVPEEHAVDVRFEVHVGPYCTFGPVTLTGLERLPEKRVALDVTVKPGTRYRPKDIASTRGRLIGLGVFGMVNVNAELVDDNPVVPVTIELRESKFREVSAGPALEFDPGSQRLQAVGAFKDHNLAGQLWRLEQKVAVGVGTTFANWSELGAFQPSTDMAPLLDLTGLFTIPHALYPKWSVTQEGRVTVGIETDYRYFEPVWSPGITFSDVPIRKSALHLGYRLSYFQFLGETATTVACDPDTGELLNDNYLLSVAEQSLSYDDRNDPMEPDRGWFWNLDLAEAGGPLAGSTSFVRMRGELRRYQHLRHIFSFDPDHFVLAGRLGAGLILPYGVDAAGVASVVPLHERLYLGGGTTVRGWAADRLGPLALTGDCETGDVAEDVTVPAGGNLAGYGNLELRMGWWYDAGLVVFGDVGRVWATPADFAWNGFLFSVGGGLRYRSSLGPIRVDVAVRLGDPPEFPVEPRWTVHFGLTEAF